LKKHQGDIYIRQWVNTPAFRKLFDKYDLKNIGLSPEDSEKLNDKIYQYKNLKDFVKDIIAHEDCVKLQKQKAKDGSNIVTANRTFTKEWNEELPAEKITAWHLVPAHTSGDAVVFFENANVAHLGDLVFNGMYPYMDLSGGCSISGSVKFLDAVINKYDDDTLFIFGHAATPEQVTGNREDVVHMKNYMEALLSFVSKQIKDGRRLEEIYSAVFVPGFEHQKANWEGALKMNLDAAYKELNP